MARETADFFVWDDPKDRDGLEALDEALGYPLDRAEKQVDAGREDEREGEGGRYLKVRLDPDAVAELGREALLREDGVHRISVDAPLVASEHLGRRNALTGAPPRDRDAAARLTGAESARALGAKGGLPVNVVIVDNGFDAAYLETLFGGGLSVAPPGFIQNLPANGPAPRGAPAAHHANMVARNVLAAAPQARLVDMPILPPRVDDVGRFVSDVLPAFDSLLARVAAAADEGWVIVCAWGVASRRFETGTQNLSDDPRHVLNARIAALAECGADVVFSAGNNGLFGPDPRSRVGDRGPHRSVFGPAALPETLTVAACDALGDWIGVSSQGVEPRAMHDAKRAGFKNPRRALPRFKDPRKPDVAAPSWFVERADRHALSVGTSASCAFAAGFVAACRARIGPQDLPPGELFAAIRETARPIGHRGGEARAAPASLRQGSGVIDGAALAARIEDLACARRAREPKKPGASASRPELQTRDGARRDLWARLRRLIAWRRSPRD